ncbi:CDP-4-dehydro-6-deoxy-D-gulose 4-reductase [Palaeococcus pacificus DY20341]|uniref:CDP-4-dehydro-6-deoxy-D-gulose 4-reductase n=1 Tax=Palaeococcus pacificus DY20341 TaxID=1343739 RepID=A0A075LY98_9EURY|nr:cell division ATPase MinD [Palaeococcus pacificus]AIF69563.1 CDP-4-dehydro-6-deoxy-D-gulose 4-reductase [Palaeococcus pacificus DY20341]
MGKLISLVSGKGGTGKTTVAANLAVALGKLGKKVVAVDADLTMANLSLVMGMDDASVTIHDVLMGDASIDEAIYSLPQFENVYVIPAAVDWEHVIKADPRGLPETLAPLKEKFDFVLIDCPAGLQVDAMSAMLSSEEVILVTNPEISCIADTMKVGIVLKKAGLAILGFVLNRYGRSDNDIPPDAAAEAMEVPLLAVIPEDRAIREGTLEGIPVVVYKPNSEGAKAFMELAEQVMRISGFKAKVMY